MISVISQGSSIFSKKSRTESIITWTQHTTTGCLRAQPPSFSILISDLVGKMIFPVHYFHPVVFNWLCYKPSSWCIPILPQAGAELITATQKWKISLVTWSENVQKYKHMIKSVNMFSSEEPTNFWFIHVQPVVCWLDLLIVVLPHHLIKFNHLWTEEWFNVIGKNASVCQWHWWGHSRTIRAENCWQ